MHADSHRHTPRAITCLTTLEPTPRRSQQAGVQTVMIGLGWGDPFPGGIGSEVAKVSVTHSPARYGQRRPRVVQPIPQRDTARGGLG
jgi:hypothetical protein